MASDASPVPDDDYEHGCYQHQEHRPRSCGHSSFIGEYDVQYSQ
jgi:hypothetical protein